MYSQYSNQYNQADYYYYSTQSSSYYPAYTMPISSSSTSVSSSSNSSPSIVSYSGNSCLVPYRCCNQSINNYSDRHYYNQYEYNQPSHSTYFQNQDNYQQYNSQHCSYYDYNQATLSPIKNQQNSFNFYTSTPITTNNYNYYNQIRNNYANNDRNCDLQNDIKYTYSNENTPKSITTINEEDKQLSNKPSSVSSSTTYSSSPPVSALMQEINKTESSNDQPKKSYKRKRAEKIERIDLSEKQCKRCDTCCATFTTVAEFFIHNWVLHECEDGKTCQICSKYIKLLFSNDSFIIFCFYLKKSDSRPETTCLYM